VRIRVATPALKERARALRPSSTPAGVALWQLLRNRSIGVKFRSQRPVGPYIVDFYCPEHGLVIEVDGTSHGRPAQAATDAERTAYLTGRGLQVIRFQNEEVMSEPDTVVERIRGALHPHACPPTARERE
jgi:very-short-patch-repair endonuclease